MENSSDAVLMLKILTKPSEVQMARVAREELSIIRQSVILPISLVCSIVYWKLNVVSRLGWVGRRANRPNSLNCASRSYSSSSLFSSSNSPPSSGCVFA